MRRVRCMGRGVSLIHPAAAHHAAIPTTPRPALVTIVHVEPPRARAGVVEVEPPRAGRHEATVHRRAAAEAIGRRGAM